MKKNSFLLIIMIFLGFAGYSQSNNSSQTKAADYVAIENQSGIQVSYVYNNTEKPEYFFVKITNLSTREQTIEYDLLNSKDEKLTGSYVPIKLGAGESFIANDLTMAIPVNPETKLSNYSTTLTIKK